VDAQTTKSPGRLFPVADDVEEVGTPKKLRKVEPSNNEHQPLNLGKQVKIDVPDFAEPSRPKTCLEVDFPIVPINALSALEGNAGKPIYQMSKWMRARPTKLSGMSTTPTTRRLGASGILKCLISSWAAASRWSKAPVSAFK
jgi:hypothetical protein